MPRALVVACLIALGLRLAAFGLLRETGLVGDEVPYAARASAWVDGRAILGADQRAPGCSWYFAAFQKVTGVRGLDGRLANVLAGTVLVALVWALARRAGGPRTAAVAALAAAVYPTLILYSPTYWSEPLYTCLLLGALLLVTREGVGFRGAAAAGVLLGAAALTREVGVFLPVAGAAALLAGRWRNGGAWARTAVLVAAFAVTLAPWVARQNAEGGAFAVVSRTTWKNLYVGNAPPPEGARGEVRRAGGPAYYRAYEKLGENLEETEAAAKELALQAIRERLPWWPLEKIVETVPDLLTPAPLPVGRLLNRPVEQGWARKWAYRTAVDGTRAEWLRDAVAYSAVAGWVLVALAGTAGLALAWGRPPAGVLALVIALHVVPVVVSFAASRFRMPFVPLLILGAAWLAVHGREAWAGASPWRRAAAVAAAVLVAVAVAADWSELAAPRWA
jgi:hypothetical protein